VNKNPEIKRAVIFARAETENDVEVQLQKLRNYCKLNDMRILCEINGKVDLSSIDFAENTAILGVDLDFDRDFELVNELTLQYQLPRDEQKNNIFFCGLSWEYQLFDNGYPHRHKYSAWFLHEILENILAQESKILKQKFEKIHNSDDHSSFEEGVEFAKRMNPNWTIELLYGFNLLEALVQRKLAIVGLEIEKQYNKGSSLYFKLYEDKSFQSYLSSGENKYEIALWRLSKAASSYRNILAHDLFVECLTMKESNKNPKSDYGVFRMFDDKILGNLDGLKGLYNFIQDWNKS
jgi:hypothetical protein